MAMSLSSHLPLFFLLGCTITLAAGAEFMERQTHLHLYYQEIDAGPNVTYATVASQHKNNTFFGDINVFHNTLTEGPDPSSTLVGLAQGMAINTSANGNTGMTIIDLIFTAGKYNGSTLSMLGVVNILGPSDRSIVGGSGKFRLARGYCLSQTINTTATTLTAEWNVTVLHYR